MNKKRKKLKELIKINKALKISIITKEKAKQGIKILTKKSLKLTKELNKSRWRGLVPKQINIHPNVVVFLHQLLISDQAEIDSFSQWLDLKMDSKLVYSELALLKNIVSKKKKKR